jgi:predicted negative regulator of RcsB-dependent stress response
MRHELGQASLTSMIAAILLMTVMGVAGVFGYKIYQFEQMSSVERLNHLWKQDMNLLKSTQHVHKGWNSIKQFEAFSGSEKAKKWLQSLRVPARKVEQGKYKLEVLLLEFDQDETAHAVVQMNLVELESQNMVWELARTYRLNSYFDHLSQELAPIKDQVKNKTPSTAPSKTRSKAKAAPSAQSQ